MAEMYIGVLSRDVGWKDPLTLHRLVAHFTVHSPVTSHSSRIGVQ